MRKLCLIALVLLLGACKEEVVKIGAPAPELAAVTMQGQPIKLANWKGQNVYLNFWSMGCGTCLVEMKELEKLSKEYDGKVTIVSVNIDPEQMSIDELLKKQGVTYSVIRDSLGMTRERYRIVGTPTNVVIGADGVVKKMLVGPQKPEAMVALFAETAKGLN